MRELIIKRLRDNDYSHRSRWKWFLAKLYLLATSSELGKNHEYDVSELDFSSIPDEKLLEIYDVFNYTFIKQM